MIFTKLQSTVYGYRPFTIVVDGEILQLCFCKVVVNMLENIESVARRMPPIHIHKRTTPNRRQMQQHMWVMMSAIGVIRCGSGGLRRS